MRKLSLCIRMLVCLLLSLFCFSYAMAEGENGDGHGILVALSKANNRIPVYYYNIKNSPVIDIVVIFDAGSRRDGNLYGLAALTAALLNKGSAHYTADQIAERFSSAGGQYEAHVSRDMTTLNLRSLRKEDFFEKNLDTLANMLRRPAFDPHTIAREKANTLVSIHESFESPADVVDNKFYEILYQNMPYAHPIIGTKASVTKLTRTKLTQFFNKYYVARNAKLVVVGDVNTVQLNAISEKITRALAAGSAAPALAPQIYKMKEYHYRIPFPTPQTNLYLGQLGISRKNPDYFALMLGNQILGGHTMASRLYEEVREKHALTYGVESYFLPLKDQGPFVIALQTRQNESDTAEKITRSVFENFLRTGPTDQELVKIKKYIFGSFPLLFTSNKAISSQIINVAFYDLPLDYFLTYRQKINAVTRDQIKQAFQRHFANRPLIKVEASQPSEKKQNSST